MKHYSFENIQGQHRFPYDEITKGGGLQEGDRLLV